MKPWTLLVGHVVHWDAAHLLWDAVVFAALGTAAEACGSRRRVAATLLLAAVAGSLTFLLFHNDLSAYRGLSGLDSALLAFVATTHLRTSPSRPIRLLFLAVLLGFAAKTAAETAVGHALFAAGSGWVNLPSVHLAGVVVGTATAARPQASAADR